MRKRTVVLAGLALAAQAVLTGCEGTPAEPLEPPPPAAGPALVAEVPLPPNYGIHDTYVRDGIAFVAAWNTGVVILDVGDGRAGGSPAAPAEIGRFVTSDNGVPGGPAAHNTWWFHNPVRNERRYLFVGQEGPASLISSSSGDLHVLDVSNLAAPVEVASLRIPGAGVHNFWMDEARQVLYAAWYNGGVVALDVSGTLSGDLTSRIIARVEPGGSQGTFVWGVMLAGGSLWAVDLVSGLWRLDPVTLATIGGGNNVAERYSSDLWIRGEYAYTGTWGGSPRGGNVGDVVNIWRVAGGSPSLVDSLKVAAVRTISDIEVSDDGGLLVVTTERLAGAGFYGYDLTDPAKPTLRYSVVVPDGLHTGTIARIGGVRYLFAAKNPPNPSLRIYTLP